MYGCVDYETRSLHQLGESYGEKGSESSESEKESILLKADKEEQKIIQENLEIISPYFSKAFYADKYSVPEDIALHHYIEYGAQNGFFPHPAFDPNWYLECFPDSASPFTDWIEKKEWIAFREARGLKLDDIHKINTPAYLWKEKNFHPKEKFFKPYAFNYNSLVQSFVNFFYKKECLSLVEKCTQSMLLSRMIAADPLKSLYKKEKCFEEHRLWVTNLTNPHEVPQKTLDLWLKGLKRTNLKSNFWCLRASDLPKTTEILKSHNIKIHEISELFPMQGYNLAYALYRNQQYTLASDIIRLNIIYQNGGIYSDIGYEYLTDPSELCNIYDLIFFHMNEQFFDRNFFFFDKGEPLMEGCLGKIHEASWFVQFVNNNKIHNNFDQHFILGCGLLNADLMFKRSVNQSIFLINDHTLIQTNRLRSWFSSGLYGNKPIKTSLYKGKKISDMSCYLYQPHVEKPFVVMTTGTFDLFHEGHLQILKRAKKIAENEAFGDVAFLGQTKASDKKLHVWVSSDGYVLSRKNKSPICNQDQRRAILEELKCVDHVSIEESEEHKIGFLKNADLVIWGHDVENKVNFSSNNKTTALFLPRTENISTTDIVQAIQQKIIQHTLVHILNPNGEIYKENKSRIDYVQGVYEVAKDLQEILVHSGVKFFFTSGTLLGIVRSGGLLQWDDDLDVYLIEPTPIQIEGLKNKIEAKGYLFKDFNNGWTGYQIFKKNEKGETKGYCDFFQATKRENGQYHIIAKHLDYFFSDEEIFPTKLGKYGNTYLTIPRMYQRIIYKNLKDNCFTHTKKYNHLFGLKKSKAELELIAIDDELPAGPF
jgi:glycerol-3-phosphate cytidylyltransferase-like family protein